MQKAHRQKSKREQEFLAAIHGCEIRHESNETEPENEAEEISRNHQKLADYLATRNAERKTN